MEFRRVLLRSLDKQLTRASARRHSERRNEPAAAVASVSKSVSEWLPTEAPPSRDDDVDTFVREHQAELLGFFRGRGARPQDAADLAQESWSRLIRYCNVQEPASLRGLLFTLARNVLPNQWRWHGLPQIEQPRQEERRAGNECVRTGKSR